MTHRALFIGGAVDGQERVLSAAYPRICTPGATYYRLFAFGSPPVFVYSVWDVSKTLLHLWNRYTGDKYA